MCFTVIARLFAKIRSTPDKIYNRGPQSSLRVKLRGTGQFRYISQAPGLVLINLHCLAATASESYSLV